MKKQATTRSKLYKILLEVMILLLSLCGVYTVTLAGPYIVPQLAENHGSVSVVMFGLGLVWLCYCVFIEALRTAREVWEE